jgi:hypothetical protein
MQSAKTLWCSYQYSENMIKSLGYNPFRENHIHTCKYGNSCRGAHNISEIKQSSEVVRFNSYNKSRIDWVKIYLDIISVIKKDVPKMKCPEKIPELDAENFITVLQLWKKLASEHRRIRKDDELFASSGYDYIEDVPQFRLSENYEDILWPFERMTHLCPVYTNMMSSIEMRKRISIRDICIAPGINCKSGSHKTSEMLCIDNFMTGECKCQTEEEYTMHCMNLQAKIKETSDVMKVKKLEEKLNTLLSSRTIHYNIIPFITMYSNHLESIKKEQDELKMMEQRLVDSVKIQSENIKPVIKLKKLGCK